MSSFRNRDRVWFTGNGAHGVWHTAHVGDYGTIIGVMPNDPDRVIVARKNDLEDRVIVDVANLRHWAPFKAGDLVEVTSRSRAHEAAVGEVGTVTDACGPAMFAVRFKRLDQIQYLVEGELILKKERDA